VRQLDPALRSRVEPKTAARLKPTTRSWRVDQTYICVKGQWMYLYRAIDSKGATSTSFCRGAYRGCGEAVLLRALAHMGRTQPRVINTDKYVGYPAAIFESKDEGVLRKRCKHRHVQYLDNVLEQDPRAIERQVNAKQHFRRFSSVRRTIEGYEAMHMIRKGQARWGKEGDVRAQARLISERFCLAC
jgi:IS6 family transposase